MCLFVCLCLHTHICANKYIAKHSKTHVYTHIPSILVRRYKRAHSHKQTHSLGTGIHTQAIYGTAVYVHYAETHASFTSPLSMTDTPPPSSQTNCCNTHSCKILQGLMLPLHMNCQSFHSTLSYPSHLPHNSLLFVDSVSP